MKNTQVEQEKYSLWNNMRFHLRSAREWNPRLFQFQFLEVIPNMAATFLGILMPSVIVQLLQEQAGLLRLILTICAMVAGMAAGLLSFCRLSGVPYCARTWL